jgi:hypothetical protein
MIRAIADQNETARTWEFQRFGSYMRAVQWKDLSLPAA